MTAAAAPMLLVAVVPLKSVAAMKRRGWKAERSNGHTQTMLKRFTSAKEATDVLRAAPFICAVDAGGSR